MRLGKKKYPPHPTPAITESTSTRTAAPSKLHSFNRYELKYLVPESIVPALREAFSSRMERDAHAGEAGYPVWSCYYDTADLRFYYEKIEGLKFRRKLRIRRYGDPDGNTKPCQVSVEIKQRVNRVTQKRRILMDYDQARTLLHSRSPFQPGVPESPFTHEILDLATRLDLRPMTITGYNREPYVGIGADLGLRVTLDHRVRGRDRDFDLRAQTENRFIIPPSYSILEIKINERAPYWVTDLTAKHGLQIHRISKYCQSVEAFNLAPRSAKFVHVEAPEFQKELP